MDLVYKDIYGSIFNFEIVWVETQILQFEDFGQQYNQGLSFGIGQNQNIKMGFFP